MVHDGDNENAPMIRQKFCGSTAPQGIISTGNELFVRFHSDSSVVSSGFEIQVEAGNTSLKL